MVDLQMKKTKQRKEKKRQTMVNKNQLASILSRTLLQRETILGGPFFFLRS